MEQKHTPGPWEITTGAQADPCSIEAADCTIANLKSARGNALANARLIAAAPELLEACKSARSAILFGGKIDWNKILDELMAAIAKAAGRE
jgi:dissimilatory sulfite reductase (desulfoviridin) alpha/beta subunit